MLALYRTPGPLRRFLLVSLQSSVGNHIAYVALLLLAYDRLRSPWAVTLILLADFAPSVFGAPLAGALADRYSRKVMAVSADVLRVGAFVGLALVGSFEATLALAFVAGVGTALYQPAAKAALPDLAGKEAGPAMNALVMNISIALMVGPAVAAGLLTVVDPQTLMYLNAASFAVSAALLVRLPLDRVRHPSDEEDEVGHRIRDGLSVVRQTPGLTVLLWAAVTGGLALALMNVAEPLLAEDSLKAGGQGFALLVLAFGIGSTIGSARAAATRPALLIGLAVCGVGLVLTAAAPNLAVALVTFGVSGYGSGLFTAVEYQLVTALSPESVRGRVFGFKESLDTTALCAGLLAGGAIASAFGPRAVFAVSGAAAVLIAAVVFLTWREPLRPQPDTT